MFDWWLNSEGFSKYILPIVLLSISTILWFAGYYWPWGWAVGGVLLVASMLFSKDKSGWETDDGGVSEAENKAAFDAATTVVPDHDDHLCTSEELGRELGGTWGQGNLGTGSFCPAVISTIAVETWGQALFAPPSSPPLRSGGGTHSKKLETWGQALFAPPSSPPLRSGGGTHSKKLKCLRIRENRDYF